MPKHRDNLIGHKWIELPNAVGSGKFFLAVQQALARLSVEFANLVLGDLPDFPVFGADETRDETLRFKSFIERNFPRGKFAALRRELDKAAARSKDRTAAAFYREVVETRRVLRSVAVVMDWFAELEGTCPSLRLCRCGKLFTPDRKDQVFCTIRCRDRFRQADWRAEQRDRYKANRIRKENEREQQRKAR